MGTFNVYANGADETELAVRLERDLPGYRYMETRLD